MKLTRAERIKLKMQKQRIKRYASETATARKNAANQRRTARIEARNKLPIEKAKLNTSVSKHAIWASNIASVFGKGADTAQGITKLNKAVQNVNGGLSSTQPGRDDDEDKDTVDSGGTVY